MESIDKIRAENIVKYDGPMGYYSCTRVLEVENHEDGTQVSQFDGFTGYSKYVNPIWLTKQHLEDIGFQFNEKTKIFSLNGVNISRLGYAEGANSMQLAFIDLGFRVLLNNLPEELTPQQMKDLTIGLPYVHSLQNYCADEHIEHINFSLINC